MQVPKDVFENRIIACSSGISDRRESVNAKDDEKSGKNDDEESHLIYTIEW